MKKRLLALIISVVLTLINFLCSTELFSQQVNKKTGELNLRNFNEEIYLITDRDIYITGEQVWFKIYKINGLTHAPCDISKVIYVELLDKNNFPLKQLKVRTDGNSGASGFLLPDNLSSGNYLIRAYTNWMKNYPADLFFYKEISVINPFGNIENLKLPSDSLAQVISHNENRKQINNISFNNNNIGHFEYTIKLQKTEYSSRENVKIVISASDAAGNPVESELSVSVAKRTIVNSASSDTFNNTGLSPSIGNVVNNNNETPLYLPELEGHLISGYLRQKGTNEAVKKTDLSLSYVGKTARCQFAKTDENGEFYFLIKEPGLNEIVIQPLSSEITGYYVELNQPFSSSFRNIKASAFYLDSSKINAINNAVISMQINNIYEPFRKKNAVEAKTNVTDFYGKPENTIKMADYIELTSLREVVKEIIPNVYTLKQNGKYDFKLINKFRGQPFENKPLVLVDGVPIYDFEKVLNINSKEIERADIINTRYFFSENIFDGIISFITKKGNLSAMEFDNSIFRQVYEGCQTQNDFYSPDYSNDSTKESRIPDFRNTLYWNPSLQTMKDGKTEIGFFTSDETAEYTIVVEGITPDGKTGFATASLIVK
jgi:hypothetical protein